MKIKSLMVPNPITIAEDAPITEAISLMKSSAIRHLPVVSEGERLRGFVTLADLKGGLIPSMLADVSLSDLMIRDPITVSPESDVESAARLIYRHKISGMPVVARGRVVGIITESDILRAFIDMMGILGRTTRVDVALPVDSAAFRRAVRAIQEAGGDIVHVGMTPRKGKEREYSFRLAAGSATRVRQALADEGFRLLEEQ